MTDRHPDEALLLDLALSDIDGHARDELTRHIALCEPCRAEYAAIADAVDHVLAAAPRVAPPPGFSRSVLAAMGMGDAADVAARQGGRRRPWLLAAAASISLLVGAAGTYAIMDARQQDSVEVAAIGPALVTGDGTRVGTVLDSWHDGRPVLVVTLADAPAGVRYTCDLVYADGTRYAAGSWSLDAAGSATWVLTPPDRGAELTGMELVTDAGTAWATATL